MIKYSDRETVKLAASASFAALTLIATVRDANAQNYKVVATQKVSITSQIAEIQVSSRNVSGVCQIRLDVLKRGNNTKIPLYAPGSYTVSYSNGKYNYLGRPGNAEKEDGLELGTSQDLDPNYQKNFCKGTSTNNQTGISGMIQQLFNLGSHLWP